MPINKKHVAKRQAENSATSKRSKRVPLQAPGEPQGRHLVGFKGMKTEAICRCGGCHPHAQEAQKNSGVVIQL